MTCKRHAGFECSVLVTPPLFVAELTEQVYSPMSVSRITLKRYG